LCPHDKNPTLKNIISMPKRMKKKGKKMVHVVNRIPQLLGVGVGVGVGMTVECDEV
jgi:hypothetical protein